MLSALSRWDDIARILASDPSLAVRVRAARLLVEAKDPRGVTWLCSHFADEGLVIGLDHLPDEVTVSPERREPTRGSDEEQRMIRSALAEANGNKREAARRLGWYPQKFYDRLRRHGIGDDWS